MHTYSEVHVVQLRKMFIINRFINRSVRRLPKNISLIFLSAWRFVFKIIKGIPRIPRVVQTGQQRRAKKPVEQYEHGMKKSHFELALAQRLKGSKAQKLKGKSHSFREKPRQCIMIMTKLKLF